MSSFWLDSIKNKTKFNKLENDNYYRAFQFVGRK